MASGNEPNHDVFPKRYENKQRKAEETALCLNINKETLLFLKKAGIETFTIDPSSLKALDQIVSPPKSASTTGSITKKGSMSNPEITKDISSTPPQEKGVMIKRDRSVLIKDVNIDSKTTTNSHLASSKVKTDTFKKTDVSRKINLAVPGKQEDEISDYKKILELLKIQNALMLDMQHRIDHLTGIVQHMATHNNGIPPLPFVLNKISPIPVYQGDSTQQQHNKSHITDPNMVARGDPHPQGLIAAFYGWITKVPGRLRESKTFKLWRLFWLLHRRYVRLDGGLFFKVFMVVALFSAKMMTRKKTPEGAFWSATAKSYLVISLVITGFLIQSGYIKFIYRFFIKENYIDRIYRGEDIVPNDVNWDEPPRRRNNNENRNNIQNVLPRNNFFMGLVPRPRANGFNIFTDIAILIGSFVLSLFPIWKPEGRPRQDEANDAANAQEGNIAEQNAENDNNNGQQN